MSTDASDVAAAAAAVHNADVAALVYTTETPAFVGAELTIPRDHPDVEGMAYGPLYTVNGEASEAQFDPDAATEPRNS